MQIAYFAGFRSRVAAANLHTHFLVAYFYKIVNNFAKEGFTHYNATYCVDIVFICEPYFSRAAGKVKYGFTLHARRNNKPLRQRAVIALNAGCAALPYHIGKARHAYEAA